MYGFRLENGQFYYLDTVNKMIWGEEFIEKTPYTQGSFMIGDVARITLADGRYLETSCRVISYT